MWCVSALILNHIQSAGGLNQKRFYSSDGLIWGSQVFSCCGVTVPVISTKWVLGCCCSSISKARSSQDADRFLSNIAGMSGSDPDLIHESDIKPMSWFTGPDSTVCFYCPMVLTPEELVAWDANAVRRAPSCLPVVVSTMFGKWHTSWCIWPGESKIEVFIFDGTFENKAHIV